MDEGNGELIAVVNSNPLITLDKLLEDTKEYLSTVQLLANDEIYYEFNNLQYVNSASATSATVLPYNVKFNVNGTVNVNALLRSTSSSAASVSFDIKVNGSVKASLRTDSTSAVSLTAKIAVQEGDIMTFDLNSNSGDASAYLSANSLMLLGRVTTLSQNNLLEVIASD